MAMLTTLVGKGLGDKKASIDNFILSKTNDDKKQQKSTNSIAAAFGAMNVKKMK